MNNTFMSDVYPGSWIKVDCKNLLGLGFEHDGIVVDVKANPTTPEDVKVVHFAWNERDDRRVIVETTLDVFMAMGTNTRIVDVEFTVNPSLVVNRARSQLGRADYNLLGRNCQHFAHWCCHGNAFSREVFKYSAFGAAFDLVVAFAGFFGMAAARGSMW